MNLPEKLSVRNLEPADDRVLEDLLAGLLTEQRSINPKWFYDERGSQLFDEITRLPEYYPTRTESAIYGDHASSIAQVCGVGRQLIEPGSGSSEKVRLLLPALRPSEYLPIDISAEYLFASAAKLAEEYPWLTVHAICADFASGWGFLSDYPSDQRVIFYPGSTLGNFTPERAGVFLQEVAQLLGSGGRILIGVDTHKNSEVLEAAYNDSAGVTASFNLNALEHINDAVGADFDLTGFSHRAIYNDRLRRIEMYLDSTRDQTVTLAGQSFRLEAGEAIHTENSYKYSPEDFARLALESGLEVITRWMDDKELFAVYALRPMG